MTVAYEIASTVKHQPNPTVLTKRPAINGPTIREKFTMVLYITTAFDNSFGPTISETNDRRSGLSNASKTPPVNAIT